MGIIESVSVNPNAAPERKKQQQVHSFFFDVYKNTVAVITGATNTANTNNNNNNNKEQFSEDSASFSWPSSEEEWESCQPVLSRANGISRVQLPHLIGMAADASVIDKNLGDIEDKAGCSGVNIRVNHTTLQEIGAPELDSKEDKTEQQQTSIEEEESLATFSDSTSYIINPPNSFCDVDSDETGTLLFVNAPFGIHSGSPSWEKTDNSLGSLTVNINEEGNSSIDRSSEDKDRLKHVVADAWVVEEPACHGVNIEETEIPKFPSSLHSDIVTPIKMHEGEINVDGIHLPHKGSKLLGRFYSLREHKDKDSVIRPKAKQTTLDDCALYKASLYVKVGEYLTLRDNSWDYRHPGKPRRCWCDLRRPVTTSALDNSNTCDSTCYANSENGNKSEDGEFTCHQRCQGLVALDCTVPALLDVSSQDEADQLIQVKCEVSAPPVPNKDIPPSALTLRIGLFNSTAAQGLGMIMEEDGTVFRGFIRVHMNLSRPIKLVPGTMPPSIYNILLQEDDDYHDKTLSSFYLPRDTVKALHITSETTTQQVITGLLKKFRVVDNPHKFALYERVYEIGETNKVRMRRLHDNEHPLWLALVWATEGPNNRRFVLQENDTGDIPWDAFTLPELNNFLRILDREEQEYLNQVRRKYTRLQSKVRTLLERQRSSSELSSPSDDPTDNHVADDDDNFGDPEATLLYSERHTNVVNDSYLQSSRF